MTSETREQVALARYKLICPVLAEPARVQNEYFRTLASQTHDLPHYGPRRIALSTFKSWLHIYRTLGFDGLKPRSRIDSGRPRRISGAMLDALRVKCKAFPHWTRKRIHEEMIKEGLLGQPPVCYNTLVRTIKLNQLMPTQGRQDIRKRYESANLNDLWICDFMHGPAVLMGNRTTKAILCVIIDDHTRMIVGWAFSPHETMSALTVVLKDAFVAYGLPKRLYVDNGAAFSAELLVKACAQAGIALVHSKPYDSPSRGKVERFFRTVRDRFLPCVASEPSLEDLHLAFSAWLAEDYHGKLHRGLDERPLDRYHAAAGRANIRRMSRTELDEIFLVRHERIVNNDATISFKSRIYEVPSAYIRQKIELRHTVDDDQELYLFDNDIRVAKLKLVNVKENASIFRPTVEPTSISYARGKVRS